MTDGIWAETTAVRDGHRLDEVALARYLADHLPGFHSPLTIRQFEGGQSNPTYYLHTPDRDYVLRKKPPGQLLPSAHQVAREYRVMTALRDSGVPVPPTHLMCMDEAIVGTPFFVMGCVDGRVFRQPHLPGVSAADRGAMYDDMVDVLARLHRVDMEAAGLGDYGKPGGMPDESTYVEAYCRRTGRTGIPDWHFYLAFSMFRLTSILQGVYARGLQGNAASAHALERGAAARAIAERGWALAAS